MRNHLRERKHWENLLWILRALAMPYRAVDVEAYCIVGIGMYNRRKPYPMLLRIMME
jgi:hypothetical protein